MLGNAYLAVALIFLIAAAAQPESKDYPAGGVLYRISAFLSSARPLIALPLAGVVLCVFFEQAIAQTTPAVPAPGWREALAKFATEALAIASPVLLAWFSWKLNQWFGLKKEEAHRDAFQTALENAAGKMVQAAGGAAEVLVIGSVQRNKALAEGLAYVQQSAPDAIAFFKLTADDLMKKLEAKVGLLVSAGDTRK